MNEVEFLYKGVNYYASEADGRIRLNDLEISIDWGAENLVLSAKNAKSSLFKDIGTVS